MKEDFEDVVAYFNEGLKFACPISPKNSFMQEIWNEIKNVEEESERNRVKTKPDGFETLSGKKKCISQIIFEKKYCIIIDNFGNKYIAKPEKGERFDKEKGFLVALAKYNGFTTTKCQELIKKAVDKDEKTAKKQSKSNGNKKQAKKN